MLCRKIPCLINPNDNLFVISHIQFDPEVSETFSFRANVIRNYYLKFIRQALSYKGPKI